MILLFGFRQLTIVFPIESSRNINQPHVDEFNLTSKMGQHSASDFTASKGYSFSGFGVCGHCPFFDPTNVEEDGRNKKLHELFFGSDPDEQLVQEFAKRLLRSVIVHNDLSIAHETMKAIRRSDYSIGKDRTIQSDHLDYLASAFQSRLRTSTNSNNASKSLAKRNCEDGVVRGTSIPDGFFEDIDGIMKGIFEVKHGTDTPADAIRQGAAEASNLAVAQLKHGVDVDDIVIPVVGSNGYLMQFGAVIMLRPSFPAFVTLTHVLDITDDNALSKAAQLLSRIFTIITQRFLGTSPFSENDEFKMMLSTQLYHCEYL